MDVHDKQSSEAKTIAIVVTIGLVSSALGFAAEATKLQLDEVLDTLGRYCDYPSDAAPKALGAIAVIALSVFRAYRHGTCSSSPVVQLCRYLSWVAWFVAMSFYIVGFFIIMDQSDTSYQSLGSYSECKVVKPGIFGAGASFTLTSILLEIIYLVHVTQNPSAQPSTVAMC